MKAKCIAIFSIVLLLLSGCGTSGNQPADTPASSQVVSESSTASQPQPSNVEKTVIRFENHGANKHELFAEAVQIFNEAQDEIYVDFQTNTTDWEASFWAALAVNDAPDIVTHISQARIPQYVDAGHLLDLSALNCSGFIDEAALSPVSYNGGIYAIPVQTEIYGVFYNKDIFDKAGIKEVPTTVDELETVIQQLKPLESENIYPFSAQYRDSGQLSFYLTYGAAGSLYKSLDEQGITASDVDDGKYNFDNNRVKSAMRIYELVRANSQPKPEDTDYTTHNSLFANGETAMLIMGNWTISQMRELAPDINVGMFALPVSNNPSDSMFAMDYNLVINVNAHTGNPEAVDKFLSAFCDYTQPTKEFFIKNALPSGLKGFDEIVTYDAALDAPLSATVTSEYFTRTLPTGFEPGKSIQEYMMDKNMSIDEAVALLQKNYEQHVSNMK